MATKRKPKPGWSPEWRTYTMPPEVQAELMALGVKHNNRGDAQLSDEENFTESQRATLKEAFIEAVETYWAESSYKKGPTEASVRENIKEIRGLIDKLIKKLDELDTKTADGLGKHGAAEVAFDICKEASRINRIRLAHEALWKTRRAARKYLREEPMSREEARAVLWSSSFALYGANPPRVAGLMVLWDGVARALGEQQRIGVRADKLSGSLAGFLDLFLREARIGHVQPRTVAEDFMKARKIWTAEYRTSPP